MSVNIVKFHLPTEGLTGTAKARSFSWILDEPESLGGNNQGPMPMEAVYGALGGCVAITLRLYAQRKEWDLGEVDVEVFTRENENRQKVIYKKIKFGNKDLTEDQIKRLNQIATKCPVSKLLQQAMPVIVI